jgi:4-hydroxyphenylpyruvate dioxygenase
VEFVEFALNPDDAGAFRTMLGQMGFHLAGRHRSKSVERWRQGAINVVVNTDGEGFAHSHQVVHGPSACAIALRVEGVGQAASRAAGLAINSFEGRIGRGEMPVQAIRDASGSLIYLVDQGKEAEMWARDFTPVADVENTVDAGLTHVDHLAYAMQDQEMLSWLLLTFTLFDVDKTAPTDVFDPLGLVRSQSVHTADRQFRLQFNGSTAETTLASRLHRRYWGAGLQYVSLATQDIFATAERLDQAGVAMLPIPANYYDDLAARFGLEADFVDRLARHNILYDRDDDGEYLQMNTRAFEKRFYFEIVERRGAYDGYGTANEVIRLSAQSRFRADEVNAL